LHRAHLLRSAGSAESGRPHPAHEQNLRGGSCVSAGVAAGSALVTAGAAPPMVLGAPRVSAGVWVLASPPPPACRVAARSVVNTGGVATLLLPAPLPALAAAAAEAHAVHLREAAGFLRWLLEKQPASWSSPQAAHSMLPRVGRVGVLLRRRRRGCRWSRWCGCAARGIRSGAKFNGQLPPRRNEFHHRVTSLRPPSQRFGCSTWPHVPSTLSSSPPRPHGPANTSTTLGLAEPCAMLPRFRGDTPYAYE
jgi:hypothetical protein